MNPKVRKQLFIIAALAVVALIVAFDINGGWRSLSRLGSSVVSQPVGHFQFEIPNEDERTFITVLYPGPEKDIEVTEYSFPFLITGISRYLLIDERIGMLETLNDLPVVKEKIEDYFSRPATLLTSIKVKAFKENYSYSMDQYLFLNIPRGLVQLYTTYDLGHKPSPLQRDELNQLKNEKTKSFFEQAKKFDESYQIGNPGKQGEKRDFVTRLGYLQPGDNGKESDFNLRIDYPGSTNGYIIYSSFRRPQDNPLAELLLKPLTPKEINSGSQAYSRIIPNSEDSSLNPPQAELLEGLRFSLVRQRHVAGRPGLEIIYYKDPKNNSIVINWVEVGNSEPGASKLIAKAWFLNSTGYEAEKEIYAYWSDSLDKIQEIGALQNK